MARKQWCAYANCREEPTEAYETEGNHYEVCAEHGQDFKRGSISPAALRLYTPWAEEPTDEQLESFVSALGYPIMATPIIKRLPYWRDSCLNLHRLFQRSVYGDTDAADGLHFILTRFKSTHVPLFEVEGKL